MLVSISIDFESPTRKYQYAFGVESFALFSRHRHGITSGRYRITSGGHIITSGRRRITSGILSAQGL